MSRLMSGTSSLMSTRPASLAVVALESTLSAAPESDTNCTAMWAHRASHRARRSITIGHPREGEILVIETEIRLRIDLAHVQRRRIAGREIEPGLGIDALGIPVDQVALADLHQRAAHERRLGRAKTHP